MSGQKLQVSYFDGHSLELQVDQATLSDEAKEALAAFLRLTNEQRLSDPSLVYGYYQTSEALATLPTGLMRNWGF